MDDINKQIQENPLTKEEAKEQFIRVTKEHGIKHAFTFDEAWDIGIELRKRNSFRDKISKIESNGIDNNLWMPQDELHALNPVKHSFADGCYIREITNPADELIVTKIHKKEHPFFLMEGEMSILTEDGIKRIKAPHHGITKVGTKRIIYTHTKCVFVTVHATNKKDISEIEDEVIAKDFNDIEITKADIELIKKSI